MRKITFLFGVFLFITISCDKEEFVETTIQGRVYDVERNIPVSGFEIRLIEINECPGGPSGSHSCPKIVAAVFSDENGNYEIVFDYNLDKEYGFQQVYREYYLERYYSRFIGEEYPIIKPGITNVFDVDAWKPSFIKLDLQVINNEYPKLKILSYAKNYTEYSFSLGAAEINETQIDTIVYLESKPNAQIELNFFYKTGNSNSEFHLYEDVVQTNLQDTISFSYLIDCSTF